MLDVQKKLKQPDYHSRTKLCTCFLYFAKQFPYGKNVLNYP